MCSFLFRPYTHVIIISEKIKVFALTQEDIVHNTISNGETINQYNELPLEKKKNVFYNNENGIVRYCIQKNRYGRVCGLSNMKVNVAIAFSRCVCMWVILLSYSCARTRTFIT